MDEAPARLLRQEKRLNVVTLTWVLAPLTPVR